MQNILIFLYLILLISKKINSEDQKECSEITDCFNCTLTPKCLWENNSCIYNTDCDNYTYYNNDTYNFSSDISYNNYISCRENQSLLDTNDNLILHHNLKYLRNMCINSKAPYLPEKNYNYKYNELSDKYCGPNFLIVDDGFLKNGYKIQLNNNNNIYGTQNLLCEYIITHGRDKINVDIFINRSLSEDFLLFYSYEYDNNIRIKYSSTLIINGMQMSSASFLFYSNKTFETSPFIIYFILEESEESEVLTYLFLAATIGFVVLAIVGIILVRKCSIFFNLKKNNKKNNEIVEENKGELSIISEKNIEENSKNEMEFDSQEIKKIKENNSNINKDNKDEKENK